ncbi:23S rRNA pseudouridine(1911/1915/1917) synthase RluD [Gammaproteobacteria bacterium]|nr:23S rRNA pseudouridine(1911/1915/1917) synthase RluD [Gammaproteobacteria bacterium]
MPQQDHARLEHFTVDNDDAGERLDRWLSLQFDDLSRSRIQQILRDGDVTVDGEQQPARMLLRGGEAIEISIPAADSLVDKPQNIALTVCYQDDDVLVLDKPAGLVVHPGAGNADGTLLNGLLHYDASLAALPRAGIVHRLDRDTAGLLVVARNETARQRLIEALATHRVVREYEAVIVGNLVSGGSVDAPIDRDPTNRLRMAVRNRGRHALTHYRIADRYRNHTRLLLRLETGRTHQIRVHMRHIGHSLVGDTIYGYRPRLPREAETTLVEMLRGYRGQALHARRLAFAHPISDQLVDCQSSRPATMQALVDLLESDREQHGDPLQES